MRRNTALPILLLLATGIHCHNQDTTPPYVPGTGEIMSNIVLPHHHRLWEAGLQADWPLANYYLHLLKGGFTRIETWHKGTPEAAAAPMIYGPLDNVQKAIDSKDSTAFRQAFSVLTTTCNTCHQATNHPFIRIAFPPGPLQ